MIEAVIFDLDGVIVSTDEYHYKAWKTISSKLDIEFNRELNNKLRGVSRRDCLNIILENGDKNYSDKEKEEILKEKNAIYIESLQKLTKNDILPGVLDVISYLLERNYKIAIGSSSRNAKRILEVIRLMDAFNCVITGEDIKASKPNPEVFLKAANCMGVKPEDCLVIEDSYVGIIAAKNANMKAVGVGEASDNILCDYKVPSLDKLEYEVVFK